MIHPFRDRTAIAGVGSTPYSKNSGVGTLTLALRAITAAVADAGLSVSDVDGLACHRIGDSVPLSVVGQSLGLRDLNYYCDAYGGGSTSHSIIGQAAMAVATGQAEVVVCWRAINARSGDRMGGTGQPQPDGLEFQYLVPYGYGVPPQQFAMVARAYMSRFGLTAEDLGAVAIAQRWYAQRNERAMMRTPLTMDDYLAGRPIVDPFRVYDCCLETDAAVAVVVTSAERARDLAHVPVTISGAVWGSGQTLFSNQRPQIYDTAARQSSTRLWNRSGLGPEDVDVAELYDAFTPLVLMQLEEYGFCQRGEAAAFVRGGHTRPDGRLPVNTHGGHLSAGYVHGLNHLMEAVEQLRGISGDRQVDGAEVALSTGQMGISAGVTSAVVLRRQT
ncbi:thiolase C-terminal domain-containing protein [Rhodococcus sp. IEGM1428]|uniref:thiolase C-terminal domain-containing protein n=1 Tax=Rhodococcus sp. IEGM1428 TaxID=3392191 RepID=UPI003D140502